MGGTCFNDRIRIVIRNYPNPNSYSRFTCTTGTPALLDWQKTKFCASARA